MAKKPKFLRTDSSRFSKLGKNRKKLQVWRAAKGRHSKIRRRRVGYPVMPSVGYGSSRKEFGKISGLSPVLVHNTSELKSLDKSSIAIIARVGARKKIEILREADKLGIKIRNGGKK